jgi:hypothetical protein
MQDQFDDQDRPMLPLETRRVLGAAIAAGTAGPGFRLTIMGVVAATAVCLVGATVFAALATAEVAAGQSGALQKLGFAVAFALPFALSLTFQIRFLRGL